MLNKPEIMTLNSSRLVVYEDPAYMYYNGERKSNLFEATKKPNCIGAMKPHIARKLRSRLVTYYDMMYDSGQVFREQKKIFHPIITMTLPVPQEEDDNTIKREVLMRFLEKMKEKYETKMQYWVAEPQKNENIHFHILTDRFIEHRWARSCWNVRCESLGMITAFELKHGHRDAPTEQVARIRSLSNSAKYVTAYTTKIEDSRGIQGRLHGESDMLKMVKSFTFEPDFGTYNRLEGWSSQGYLHKTVKEGVAVYSGDMRSLLREQRPKFYQKWREFNRLQA